MVVQNAGLLCLTHLMHVLQVDRKASKGRRLRYQVHDKLAGFVAAIPLDTPSFAGQLFSNLFGQARNAV